MTPTLGCLLPDSAAVVAALISKHRCTVTLPLKPMGNALGVKVMDTFGRTTGRELNKTAKRTMRSDWGTSRSMLGSSVHSVRIY